MKRIKKIRKWTTVLTAGGVLLFSLTSTTQAHWLFKDIDHVAWAQESIINAYQMNVIDGIADREFAPQSQVTWAQFIKMVVMTDNPAFTAKDAANGGWWQPYFTEAMQNKGFIDGSVKKEQMNRPISRLELARIVSRVIEPSLRSKAVDDKTAADISRKNGILQGRTDTDLALGQNLTRAEAAVIIDRLFEKNGKYGKRHDTLQVKAENGRFILNGLAAGQTTEEVHALLGQPFAVGKDEADGNPEEVYKNFVVTYYEGKVSRITFKGADRELLQAKKDLGGAAVFQNADTTFYYFPATSELLTAANSTVYVRKDGKNFPSYVQGGELKAVNAAAKAYADSLKSDTPAASRLKVTVDNGAFALNGLTTGMSSRQVQILLGKPLQTGFDEVDNNPMETYSHFIVTYLDGQSKQITYKGTDSGLAGGEELAGAAIFKDKDTAYYYIPSTSQLLTADSAYIRVVKDGKNFPSYVKGGETASR
ncbi:S-layer homology domain-containing protein [Paenibacillus sp. 1P03SA]|uniref:S-layer homology domain-containing protein n=1 Tax=Paenibacillus sp. 1P03SA TaxID=3132294 RepID=UPI0039A07917